MTWTLPVGASAGEGAYPVPGRLLIDGSMNHVYFNEYAILVPLRIPKGMDSGSRLPVELKISYLVCSRETCVPESADVSTELTIGNGAKDPSATARFAAWRAALPQRLAAPASFAVEQGKLRVAIPLSGNTAMSDPHLFVDAAGVVNFAAAQQFTRRNDTLIVETASAGPAPGGFDAVLALSPGKGVSFHARPGSAPASGDQAGAGKGTDGKRPLNIALLTLVSFGGAILGGLILNVMPCVFPILSLKALSLARSGDDNGSARREAVAYAAGVILICVSLGGLILALRATGSQVGWAFQLQNPDVIFVLILLVGAIAFNLAGLFEVTAVSAGSGLAAKSGLSGAFWTGALAAFVATPCTGPFMAAALGAALVLPTPAALFVFVGLGIGLALPFVALGFVPKLRGALPRPGQWMIVLRQILAAPMFVTALGLAWVLGNQTGAEGIILALAALLIFSLGLWITGIRQHTFKARAWLPGVVALLLSLAILPALPKAGSARSGETGARSSALRFDDARLASLRAQDRPVFLYLTAAWCLTCKVNERLAIDREETQSAFAKAHVITMIGDWTDGNQAITRFLQRQGRAGVPLYLWYGPGKEAQVLPQVLTPAMLRRLAESSRIYAERKSIV